jgi:multidrug efflux pump subunit AcrB
VPPTEVPNQEEPQAAEDQQIEEPVTEETEEVQEAAPELVEVEYNGKTFKVDPELREAVMAAGATRLRPVVLTAVTTILGLIPMVTGVSYDFHKLAISWVSESSQWWSSMAIVVIFGLMVATFLTLLVVPVLYVLIEESKGKLAVFRARLKSYIPGS